MYRKRRQPAPFFRMPGAPFNPTTGQRAELMRGPGKGTTLAIFQVVAEDTHDNYIECRGYEAEADPNFQFLHDPYLHPATTPINVAKPYSVRGTNPYVLGQVIVAARINTKLGYTPGKAATTVGQPADLDEEIEILLDDDDKAIAWLDISQSPVPLWRCEQFEGTTGGTAASMYLSMSESISQNGFASVSGDTITIGAGLTNQPVQVSWWMSRSFLFSTDVNWLYQSTFLEKNGSTYREAPDDEPPQQVGASVVKWEAQSFTYNWTFEKYQSGTELINLSTGDTLKIKSRIEGIENPGGSTASIVHHNITGGIMLSGVF